MNPRLSLLFAALLIAGCSSGFQPLHSKPAVLSGNRPLPPENPVYGVPSYEAPLVWVVEAPATEIKGRTRLVKPRVEPAAETLAQAVLADQQGDKETALQLLQQAADAGNGRAHYELAHHYLMGDGVPADPAQALNHLSQADALGNAEASRVLAWNYLRGTGVPQDLDYGKRLLEKSARTNDRALRELSLLYLGTCQPDLADRERGLAQLKVASAAGDRIAASLYQMAQQQDAGQPLPASAEQPGLPCLASDPVAPAERDATAIALDAEPVSSEAEAEATKRQALAGDPQAMYDYGQRLLDGTYPSLQPELEAYAWFAVAADHGHPEAPARVASLAPVRDASEQQQPGLVESMIAALDSAIVPNPGGQLE